MNAPETNLPPEARTESAKADSVQRVVRRRNLPCRKCEAEAITDGLCAKHYLQMLEQFETQSSKANLKVGAAPSNDQALPHGGAKETHE